MSRLNVDSLSVTGTLVIPSFTTSTRPTPEFGKIILNTDTNKIEFYNGVEWLNKKKLDGLTPETACISGKQLIEDFPNSPNQAYWVQSIIGPIQTYIITNSAFDGGGWMSLTPQTSPQIDNVLTSSSWETNSSNRLEASCPHILNVNIVETSCVGTSYYELKSPALIGWKYNKAIMLMERINTIGQCSRVPNDYFAGWYNGPLYRGVATTAGMCTWGDGNFANACCGAQNLTGLKIWWVIKAGTNDRINYSVRCAGGSGTHYHQWFVK